MTLMIPQAQIFTCGHIRHTAVPMGYAHRERIRKMPGVCSACHILKARDEYMKELAAKALGEEEKP